MFYLLSFMLIINLLWYLVEYHNIIGAIGAIGAIDIDAYLHK